VTASVPEASKADASKPDASKPGESKREPASRNVGFPRSARLLRHADFERVYKMGRRHFSASLTAFYLLRTDAQPGKAIVEKAKGATRGLRIGFTVGRALGGAVQRNRMKRRLREAVRLCGVPTSVAADVVINPKKSLLIIDFAEVVNEVKRAFVLIEQKLSGKAGVESGKRISGNRKPEARS
jgi:ribonuclease P protein component